MLAAEADDVLLMFFQKWDKSTGHQNYANGHICRINAHIARRNADTLAAVNAENGSTPSTGVHVFSYSKKT